jgi:hypothetical protein
LFSIYCLDLFIKQHQNTKTMTNFKPLRPLKADLYQYYYPTKDLQSRLDYFVGYLNSSDSNLSDCKRKDLVITVRQLIYELNIRKSQELETGKTWEMGFANAEEIEEMREILKKQNNPALR